MENQPIDQLEGQTLPNSVGVLVLGILSIVFCLCYGFIGLTLGIIALIMGNKALKLYNANPDVYTEASLKNVKAGRICGIVGLCLSSAYVIVIVIYIAVIGAAVGTGIFQELNHF